MFLVQKAGRIVLLALMTCPVVATALPTRLVLAVDGIAYRDLVALQSGVTRTNFWGHKTTFRAFTAAEGYFPVSRMVSTFPSLSDIAWTDIFGDRPLPGYQRIYYSDAANAEIFTSGVTTTMEYESQMDWQEQSGFLRSMGYLFPMKEYKREVRGFAENFWQTTSRETNYYAYIRASDDAQHLDRNIFKMLSLLDRQIQDLRARYRQREGRDLQIVILSDHGHNHAGRARRVGVRSALQNGGYRVARTIASPRDVVVPDGGIEDWVEIHNAPSETEKLASLLCRVKGVDIVTAVLPDEINQFLVLNGRGDRAIIEWQPKKNSFRYTMESGDPLGYGPAVEALKQNHQLDAQSFATGDAWLAVTMTNRYPLALERIARGFARNVLNPATIILSLDNHYAWDDWWTQQGSRLVTCRSTHGALDDLNSDGILLSNFQPTHDTSTDRVAAQIDNFPNVRNFRAAENGAELVTRREQELTRTAHVPFDHEFQRLPDDDVYLRIWAPELAAVDGKVPLNVAIEKVSRFTLFAKPEELKLRPPLANADSSSAERIYALPSDLHLEPLTEYKMSGWILEKEKVRLFAFNFHTNREGKPAAY